MNGRLPRVNWAIAGGAVVFLSGVVGLFAYPLTRAGYLWTVGATLYALAPYFTALGAVALVWGLSILRTREWHSMTPIRAFAAPVLVFVPYVVAAFVEDSSAAVRPVGPAWTPPASALELAARIVGPSDLVGATVVIPAALFLVVGTALFRNEPRWIWLAAGCYFLLALVNGSASGWSASWLVNHTLGPLLLGVLPFVVGYHAAAPSAEWPVEPAGDIATG